TLHKIQKYVNGDNVIAICVDKPPYKRKDIDPNYKANRSKAPPLAVEQLRRVIEHLENDGFPVLGSDGYEADDIIATIVDTMHKRDETPCMSIISSDKDLSQLLAPGIKQTSPMTGETLDINSAVEKFCVMPSEIGGLLALMGDKSDNVPGVPGIGPKTAVTLLKTHSWDTLIELVDLNDPDGKLAPAGVRQKLLDNFDNLKKSRELVRLMTDAPIDVDSIFKPRVRKVTEVEKINNEQFPEVVETATADNRFYRQKEATSTPSTAIVKSDKWALRLEPTDSE
ncbi:MAG: hypothetical protein GY841_08630, partial [FCB group bacterium]|nr:hypothetical protein [FCB group bacterium]